MQKTIKNRIYIFDYYTLDGVDFLRISRLSWKKQHVVKVYTGDLDGKMEEFIKSIQ